MITGDRFDRTSRHIALALLLLLAAAALPQVRLPAPSSDAVVVFDITQSMNVEDQEIDGTPVDRLTYARHAARSVLDELPCGTRIGWAVFAEYRSLLLLAPVEVCAHYGDLLSTLERIDGRMRWADASEVSKGVFWALRMAKEMAERPHLVFLTDGHEAPPLRAAGVSMFDDLKPGEVGGWLLGVGGDLPRPIPKTDADGKRFGYWRPEDVVQPDARGPGAAAAEHLSGLRESHLQGLARQVGFDYARLTGGEALRAALLDARFAHWRVRAVEVGWLPAAGALLVLALAFGRRAAGAPAGSSGRGERLP